MGVYITAGKTENLGSPAYFSIYKEDKYSSFATVLKRIHQSLARWHERMLPFASEPHCCLANIWGI